MFCERNESVCDSLDNLAKSHQKNEKDESPSMHLSV